MRRGIDAAWGAASLNPRSLGASFVARYLGHDASKCISLGEARHDTALGVDLVVVFEDQARRCLGGRAAGVADAHFAEAQAKAAGMPAFAPIYFACDDDFGPGDQGAINEYFRGVASVLGVHRTGAYAGYYVIKRLFDAGLIKYGWQTAAWSGGHWDPRAQIQQYSFGQVYDWDRTEHSDFGQWRVGQHRTPKPPNWFLLPDEKHWVQTFDHFIEVRHIQHGHLGPWGKSHLDHMNRLMAERRKKIYTVAQHTGWSRLNRHLRYQALRDRTDLYRKLYG